MSKEMKVLVFKDWEKTKGVLEEVVRTGVPSAWNGVWSILLGHTLDDPVVFEAEAMNPMAIIDPQTLEIDGCCFTGLSLPLEFKDGDKLQVIVAKKEEKGKEET